MSLSPPTWSSHILGPSHPGHPWGPLFQPLSGVKRPRIDLLLPAPSPTIMSVKRPHRLVLSTLWQGPKCFCSPTAVRKQNNILGKPNVWKDITETQQQRLGQIEIYCETQAEIRHSAQGCSQATGQALPSLQPGPCSTMTAAPGHPTPGEQDKAGQERRGLCFTLSTGGVCPFQSVGWWEGELWVSSLHHRKEPVRRGLRRPT